MNITSSLRFAGELTPHQLAGVEWLLDHPKAVLADDVGLGKTIQALALIDQLDQWGELPRVKNSPCRVLWLTGSTLMQQTRSEIERFLPGYSVATSDDPEWQTTQKGRKLMAERFGVGPDILVVTYDQALARLGWLEKAIHPSLVVLDEVSNLGHGKGQEQIRDLLTKRTQRVLAMGATPIQNGPMDLYGILAVTDTPGLWRPHEFKELVGWEQTHIDKWGNPQFEARDWINDEAVQAVKSYLSGVVLRRTAEEVGLRLPTLTRATVWVPLTTTQREAYQQAGAKGLKAHQERQKAGRLAGYESSLVDALTVELAAHGGTQAVVGCESLEVLDLVSEALEKAGITYARIDGSVKGEDRDNAVMRHRQGRVRVLLGSMVLEHGLNLQHCRLLISLDSSWNPAREHQREGRIWRLGSRFDEVEYIKLLPDTDLARTRESRLDEKLAVARAVEL